MQSSRSMVSIRLLILIFTGTHLHLACAKTQEVESQEQIKFEKAFKSRQIHTSTFEAGLRQTLRLQGMKKPVISTGHIYYQTPDRLLILFDEPSDEFVLLNGKHFVFRKSGEDVEERTFEPKDQSASMGIAMLIGFFKNGAASLKDSHRISMVANSDKLDVTLKPIQSDEHPSEIVTTLRLPDLEIISQRICFTPENELNHEFIKPKRNQKLKDGLFDWPRRMETPSK